MDLLAELRRRLDVPATIVPDAVLTHFLDVAGAAVAPWLIPDPAPYTSSVEEATIQLAAKLYDLAPHGVSAMSPDGTYTLPAASAAPGLVRAVFGALGPALRFGGLSM